MTSIIKVENLSKQYQIGGKRAAYSTLRDTVVNTIRNPLKSIKQKESNSFWALNDVSFEVETGEVVGIIGRNGAGKSTLLKILSRITEPTEGKIELYGRIASLLEVGTGFHPELSGRENIYLNGAILGMRRSEIQKKFDEIVAFAEIEKFIETPVKHYSSGMYVRLAFAVAAHLEPEILVVDEVLAVGDSEFQKKCLGKMGEVAKGGRTVLFVSHQMGTIAQLCEKTLVLDKGSLQFVGDTDKAIDFYSNNSKNVESLNQSIINPNEFQFLKVCNCDENYNEKSEFHHNESIQILTEIYTPKLPTLQEFALCLYDKNKRPVFTIHEPLAQFYQSKNSVKLITTIPPDFLTPGVYSWLMCINTPDVQADDLQDDICRFSIVDAGSKFARYETADYGCVFPNYSIKQL